ncbi:MAG: hypothetical protein AAGC74_12185 [Verrucomicrobiota bacterium]
MHLLPKLALFLLAPTLAWSEPITITITIQPEFTRAIEGISKLDRKKYFNLADSGQRFLQRLNNPDLFNQLTQELDIHLGRNLGPVAYRGRPVKEDPERPGHAHLPTLLNKLNAEPVSPELANHFGSSLDIAAHGQPGTYPEFMGNWRPAALKDIPMKKGAYGIPKQSRASAELAAHVLKYGYNDLTRPRYFEPINEPSWAFLTEPEKIARWHLDMKEEVQKLNPDILVGGPCNPVGYFYGQNYKSFNGIKNFMEATKGQLDFYSFHIYDYYRWNEDHFTAATLSGLPLEGVLDLVANYSKLAFGSTKPIVVSEHGGYASGSSSTIPLVEDIARTQQQPKQEDFAWKLDARRIHNFLLLDSVIANTLTFMEHPHVIQKAVPFILLESKSWDPEYYASLLVAENFDKKSKTWIPTGLLDFYRLFQDVRGDRILATSPVPDIQVRAFRDNNQVTVVLHNLSSKPETLALSLPKPNSSTLRRFSRQSDLRACLTTSTWNTQPLTLGADETIVLTTCYNKPLPAPTLTKETIHYANQVLIPEQPDQQTTITIPPSKTRTAATLRISFNRPHQSSRELTLLFNGHPFTTTTADCEDHFDHPDHGFTATRFINIPLDWLQTTNTIELQSPANQPGKIGAITLRIQERSSQN